MNVYYRKEDKSLGLIQAATLDYEQAIQTVHEHLLDQGTSVNPPILAVITNT